jgi:ABC-type Fe3+-siderophore transport system permease subunit
VTPGKRLAFTMALATTIAAAGFVQSLTYGPTPIDPSTFWTAIVSHDASIDAHMIARDIRLPRAILALIVGGALSLAGGVMQGITRNPLAGPSIMGLSSGGSLGMLLAMISVPTLSYNAGIGASLAGATLGYACVLAVAVLSPHGFAPARLALAGAIVTSLFEALTHSLVIYYRLAGDMLYWTVGGITTASWPQLFAIAPLCLLGFCVALACSGSISVLSLGQEAAIGLGQRTLFVRAVCTISVLFLTASAVAVAGPISFIGLMVPHFARMLVGADYRRLLPASLLIGAGITVWADVAARSALGGWKEVPLGILTAAIGAPCFVWLIQRRAGLGLEAGLTIRSSAGPRVRPARQMLPLLVALLCAALWLRLQFGFTQLPPQEIVQTLLGYGSPSNELALWSFRLPRAIFAALSGAGIAVAGAMFQSILRNDLAEPGILGVSAGANLAIVLVLATMTGAVMSSVLLLPAAAVCGAIGAMTIVSLLSLRSRHSGIRLLLTGVAVSSALGAFTLLLSLQLSERIYKFAVAFTAGSLSTAGWNYVAFLGAWLAILLPLAWSHSPTLNVLRTGDETATGLGVPVAGRTYFLLTLSVAICAGCMALSGGALFLGLIAPHIARRLVGADHFISLPAAALVGASLLLVADVAGNTLFSIELPAGVMVSALGSPYFLYLLVRS